MNRMQNMGATIGLLMIGISTTSAQVDLKKVGQSTMNFQNVSISPAASAMGGAYCALSQGAESIFHNPAGLVEAESDFEMKLFTTQWIADINYMAGSFVWKSQGYGSLGLSFVSVDYGTFKGNSLVYPQEMSSYPDGYRETGNFSPSAYSLGLTYAKQISTQFSLGGNVRIANQSLGSNSFHHYEEVKNYATGETLIYDYTAAAKKNNISKLVYDGGVKYYTYDRDFWFGMSIRNFSSNVIRERIAEQMPILFTLGVGMDFFDLFAPDLKHPNPLTVAIDFQHSNNYTERFAYGFEYVVAKILALRSGYYSNHDLASWSIGFGINASLAGKPIQFDYSYSNMDVFDGVNRFSIALSL